LGAAAAGSELRVRHDGSDDRPAEARRVRRSVLGRAAAVVRGYPRDGVPEIPQAGRVAPGDWRLLSDRPVRVEGGAARWGSAPGAGDGVAVVLRCGQVGLELDRRIGVTRGIE